MNNNEQNMGTIGIVTNKIENVEWVFQFNEDEPIKMAEPSAIGGAKELTLRIGNTSDSNIIFHDGKGNQFKIFAREKK